MTVTLRLLFVVSALLLFVSMWIVLPAPHPHLLPFAVAAPELSPALVVSGGLVLGLLLAFARRGRIEGLSVVFASASVGLALIPVAQLPFTIGRFNEATTRTSVAPNVIVPGAAQVTRGVQFSTADGIPLSLNVYRPPSGTKFPIVMQIYGGSWQTGAPERQEWFSQYLAQRGYLVIAIDYRHVPQWIWPEQIVDVRNALYWISQDSPKFGGDPSRIVVIGRSAGAQLAMRLAYQEGPASIRGVVNYYGPVDLADGWRRPPYPDPANVRAILAAFIGGTPDQKPEHYRHASPITYVSKSSAPTLSIYGARDHIVDVRYGRMLDEALRKAGATSVLLELPWSEHSFDAVPNGLGRRISLYYVERFIAWAVNR